MSRSNRNSEGLVRKNGENMLFSKTVDLNFLAKNDLANEKSN